MHFLLKYITHYLMWSIKCVTKHMYSYQNIKEKEINYARILEREREREREREGCQSDKHKLSEMKLHHTCTIITVNV